MRIGLAHGSITAFGAEAARQPNVIDPARPAVSVAPGAKA